MSGPKTLAGRLYICNAKTTREPRRAILHADGSADADPVELLMCAFGVGPALARHLLSGGYSVKFGKRAWHSYLDRNTKRLRVRPGDLVEVDCHDGKPPRRATLVEIRRTPGKVG